MTSDDLSRLFDAERAVQPPPQAVEHGLARLLADVAQRVTPLSVAAGSLKLGVSAVSKWLIGGFVMGMAGAGVASKIWAPAAIATAPAAVASVAQAARVEAPLGSPAPRLPSDARAEPKPEPTGKAISRSERPMPSAAPAVNSNAPVTFDAELQLITAAKTELDKGRPQLAAAWLSEHAQRFPAGIFAPDREALRILVRCSQVKDPAAARAFAARHPSSPMVERLLRACRGSEPAAVDFPK